MNQVDHWLLFPRAFYTCCAARPVAYLGDAWASAHLHNGGAERICDGTQLEFALGPVFILPHRLQAGLKKVVEVDLVMLQP